VVDEVVFAVPMSRLGEIEDAVWVCEEVGVVARIAGDFARLLGAAIPAIGAL